ncbi:probable serine/threonine-protein kinase DDB_G0272282 [Argonauta hians]
MNHRVSKVKHFKKKMRINEKSLIHFANSNRSSDKEGYLQKKGELNKSFQKRWFILKGNLLFYYEKKHDKEPIGVVVLEGCTIELAAAHHINSGSSNNGSSTGSSGTSSGESFTFEIVFPRSGARTYVLSSSTQEEMESWMKALTCASYDYLKMMVTELQRQLEEANLEQTESAMEQIWENSTSFGNAVNSGGCSSNIMTSNLHKNNVCDSVSSDCSSHRSKYGEDGDGNMCPRYPFGQHSRFNPFNSIDNDSDMFTSDSNKILNSSQSHHSGLASAGNGIQNMKKSRTFIQMHEEFGKLLK